MVASVESKAPNWMLIYFATLATCAAVLYLAAFIFCLFNDRDALRSETYSIQKLAIEKGFVGDSSVGVLDERNQLKLPVAARGEEQE
jgi:hypothetical protein